MTTKLPPPSSLDSALPALEQRKAELARLRAAGLALIPLRGKHPICSPGCPRPHEGCGLNWEQQAPDKYTVGALAAGGNVGVHLGPSRLLVIDVDPRNFAAGDRPFKRLVEQLGALPETFVVRTGGGGLHVYLRLPEGHSGFVRNSLKEFPGVEFKAGTGKQVVGPGSVHPDSGRQYEAASGNIDKIAEAPPALLALILRSVIPWDEVKSLKAYDDSAAAQGRFAAFLIDTAAPSVQGKGGDNNAFKVAAYGRDLGLSPAITWELMLGEWNARCAPPWSAEELREKVVHAYLYARGGLGAASPSADFTAVDKGEKNEKGETPGANKEEISWVLDKAGKPTRCYYNLLNYFRLPEGGLRGLFAFNEFAGQIEFTIPAPWHGGRMPHNRAVTDADLTMLRTHIASRLGFEANGRDVKDAMVSAAYARRFHPVREYLDSLTWDKTPRLDSWLIDYFGAADTPYVRAVARKVLCGAVKRIYKPGCKFDHVLVLEGQEGIGKSTAVKILAGEYAQDFPIDPHHTNTVQLMQGQWIVELAEMEVTRRADEDALKAFLTRTKDKARFAWGIFAQEYPRQSIFIASKNPTVDGTYLAANAENRRWWPVECLPPGGKVNFKKLKANRNQLWAEAVARMKEKGEELFMETQELADAAREQAATRRASHAWTERLRTWLASDDGKRFVEVGFVTGRDVFCLGIGGHDVHYDKRASLGVGSALRELGWYGGVRKIDGEAVRGFLPYRQDSARQRDRFADATAVLGPSDAALLAGLI